MKPSNPYGPGELKDLKDPQFAVLFLTELVNYEVAHDKKNLDRVFKIGLKRVAQAHGLIDV